VLTLFQNLTPTKFIAEFSGRPDSNSTPKNGQRRKQINTNGSLASQFNCFPTKNEPFQLLTKEKL